MVGAGPELRSHWQEVEVGCMLEVGIGCWTDLQGGWGWATLQCLYGDYIVHYDCGKQRMLGGQNGESMGLKGAELELGVSQEWVFHCLDNIQTSPVQLQ